MALDIQWAALHVLNPRPAVLAGSRRIVPVAIGGSGKRKVTANGARHGPHDGPRASLGEMLRDQGLPETFLDDAPFTCAGKRHAIGNGVPLPMGRAVAKAVRAAIEKLQTEPPTTKGI
jgi:DNA (cytosine-5)-methyltransferase 1